MPNGSNKPAERSTSPQGKNSTTAISLTNSPSQAASSTIIISDDDNDDQDNEDDQDDQMAQNNNRVNNWTNLEDISLCKSWAKIILDPRKRSGVNPDADWIRIHKDYENQRKTGEYREKEALRSHWDNIHNQTMVFIGHHDSLERMSRSGKTPEVLMEEARYVYREVEKHEFDFPHCLAHLRHVPIFMNMNHMNEIKRPPRVKRRTDPNRARKKRALQESMARDQADEMARKKRKKANDDMQKTLDIMHELKMNAMDEEMMRLDPDTIKNENYREFFILKQKEIVRKRKQREKANEVIVLSDEDN